MLYILQEIRVKQYTKNMLVFAAPLFGGMLFNYDCMLNVLIAFIAFSFAASTIYIVNDIVDFEKDRLHPVKCKRPIAAGKISKPKAFTLGLFLVSVSMYISHMVNPMLSFIIMVYMVMNLLYSFKLKHYPIVDVMIIALGFVMRAFAGVVASGLSATNWFILCVFMLCLFLGLAKRRNELILMQDNPENSRKVLSFYNIDLIDQLSNIVAAVMLTSYALFASQTGSKVYWGINVPLISFSVPIVVYGVFRYLLLIHLKGLGERPEDVLLHDKHILVTVLLYIIVIILARNI